MVLINVLNMLTTAIKVMLRKFVRKLVEPVVATLETILRAHARTSTTTAPTIRTGAPAMLKSRLVVLPHVELVVVTPNLSATARISPVNVLHIKITVLMNKFLSIVRRLVVFVNYQPPLIGH